VVHVTGTHFDVGWVPETDTLELTLHDGRVELSGCVFGTGYRVLAGQTVRASCRNEHFDVTSTAGAAAVQLTGAAGTSAATPSQPTPAPEIVPASPARARANDAPKPTTHSREDRPKTEKSRSHVTWQGLARAGRYLQALEAARALGFHQECTHVSAEDLRTLANVARYGQDSQGEAEALQGLRTRFPGTKRAAWAAFALGRLEFDNHAAYAEAAEWFRIYLNEEPHGDLAREALGRLLEAKQRHGELASARELADRYLRDYPQGPHADLARALLPARP
jgi:TolA-binding protein